MKKRILIVVGLVLVAAAAIAKLSLTENSTADKTETAVAPPEDDLKGWSDASKIAVMMMKKKYGEPNEKTETMMMWKNTGQWDKTIVYAKEFHHDFPMPHTDVMEQFIDYEVPADKFDELAMYDGSVVCNRTNGKISARCDKEEANFLAINLAHDIITGKKDVNAARDEYAKAVKEMINGGKPEYMQKLQFNFPGGKTEFKDERNPIITDEDIKKAKEMMEKQKKESEAAMKMKK
jgi:hypothetical protein